MNELWQGGSKKNLALRPKIFVLSPMNENLKKAHSQSKIQQTGEPRNHEQGCYAIP